MRVAPPCATLLFDYNANFLPTGQGAVQELDWRSRQGALRLNEPRISRIATNVPLAPAGVCSTRQIKHFDKDLLAREIKGRITSVILATIKR
jgi:hypothetical protein